MKTEDIIRAWKDDAFRESLSLEEQALLPDNPAGLVELDDQDLFGVAGGEEAPSTLPCALSIASLTTLLISCSQCDTTIFDGSTCVMLSAGCC